MNKIEIIQCIKSLNFSSDEFWVVAGAAMVLYGFREETADLDLGCSKWLADELQKKNYPVEILEDGKRKIKYSSDIEIFEDWIIGEVKISEGIPLVSIEGLIRMKEELGRDKDLKDLELIKELTGGFYGEHNNCRSD